MASRKTWIRLHRSRVSQIAIVCATYMAISYYIMRKTTSNGLVDDEYSVIREPKSGHETQSLELSVEQPARAITTGASLYGNDKIQGTKNNSSVPKPSQVNNTSNRYCDIDQRLSKNYWRCKSLIVPGVATNATDISVSKSRSDTNCNLETIYNNCSAVMETYMFGKELVTEEEQRFPLAFALKIHRSPNQAHRLLRLIFRKHNFYCVHIDRKSPEYIYDQFKALSTCFDNVAVIDDRVDVVYSTIRQIEAEIKCIDAARRSNVDWRYYINLTGQEFMLKTNYEIVQILKLLNGMNDIEGYPVDGSFVSRFKLKTKIRRSKSFPTAEKKEIFIRNIILRKGSAYGMFSRKFIEFIRTDTIALEFISWLNETYAPEEFVWATLNYLPLAPGGYQGDLHLSHGFLSRAEIWQMDRENIPCRGIYSRWVCVFGTGDLPWLVRRREIVANKFSIELFPLAIDCLEQFMYRRTMGYLPETFRPDVYSDAPHIQWNPSKPDSL